MRKYDFDTVINRENTDSFKWDMNEEYFGKKDVIPMWVADMDFRCAAPIVSAIKKRAEHPVFGYTVRKQHFYDAVLNWLSKRHNCKIDAEWLAFAPPGVIYAIYVMLQIVTDEGDKVVVSMPNYDPLFDLVVKSGRKLVENPLKTLDGRFILDLEALRKVVEEEKPKALIISSPHNPTGRVWTKEELSGLAQICIDNGVYMLVDEIHADFVAREKHHIAFATLGEKVAQNSMICYSANKGFNLGGLQMSTLIIADKEKRDLFNEQMLIAQTRLDTSFGAVATETAYTNPECEEWLDEAIAYVDENKRFVDGFLKAHCPKVRMIDSEGTYLVWLDCRELGLQGKELEDFMVYKAGVAFSAGYEFGEQGKDYMRMNLACSQKLIKKALMQVAAAVEKM